MPAIYDDMRERGFGDTFSQLVEADYGRPMLRGFFGKVPLYDMLKMADFDLNKKCHGFHSDTSLIAYIASHKNAGPYISAMLTEKNVEVNQETHEGKLLELVLRSRDTEATRALVNYPGFDPHYQIQDAYSLFNYNRLSEHPEKAADLSFDINEPDQQGRKPFSKAIENDDVFFLNYALKDKNFDINSAWVSHESGKEIGTPIVSAIGSKNIYRKILENPKTDLNKPDYQDRTALIELAGMWERDTLDYVDDFLAHGADPNLADREGKRPLDIAIAKDNFKFAQKVLPYTEGFSQKEMKTINLLLGDLAISKGKFEDEYYFAKKKQLNLMVQPPAIKKRIAALPPYFQEKLKTQSYYGGVNDLGIYEGAVEFAEACKQGKISKENFGEGKNVLAELKKLKLDKLYDLGSDSANAFHIALSEGSSYLHQLNSEQMNSEKILKSKKSKEL